MELAESASATVRGPDPRPRMQVPPPVKLLAVADVHLTAMNGSEKALDAFYVGLLQFERDTGADRLTYRAEKFAIVFELMEKPEDRDEPRTVGISVPSLAVLTKGLFDLGIEYQFQRSIMAGMESVLCNDPAGNQLEISQTRILM